MSARYVSDIAMVGKLAGSKVSGLFEDLDKRCKAVGIKSLYDAFKVARPYLTVYKPTLVDIINLKEMTKEEYAKTNLALAVVYLIMSFLGKIEFSSGGETIMFVPGDPVLVTLSPDESRLEHYFQIGLVYRERTEEWYLNALEFKK